MNSREQIMTSEHEKEVLTTIQELTDEQRLDARERAQEILLREIGDKPQREQYIGVAVSEYPLGVRRLVAGLMAVVFIAAALPSLFRLYDAGRIAHMDITNNIMQARIVGLSTFVLAEFLIITSTLALSIYAKNWWQRVLFIVAITMGLGVAFVGNWAQVEPDTLFKLLETIAPPLTVVVMSFVGERLVMDGVKKSHEDERAFQQALAQHQQSVRNIEQHKRWFVTYGRALMGAIRHANTTENGRTKADKLLASMTRRDWRIVVNRELATERGDWLTDDDTPNADESEQQPETDSDSPFGRTVHGKDVHASTPVMRSVNGHTAAANSTNN